MKVPSTLISWTVRSLAEISYQDCHQFHQGVLTWKLIIYPETHEFHLIFRL